MDQLAAPICGRDRKGRSEGPRTAAIYELKVNRVMRRPVTATYTFSRAKLLARVELFAASTI
jgi:hypothetical protein